MQSEHQKALELARAGHWEKAHATVQAHSDELSCLVHGYLHRVEGDMSNAAYWYRQGNAELPTNTLDEEWQRLYTLL